MERWLKQQWKKQIVQHLFVLNVMTKSNVKKEIIGLLNVMNGNQLVLFVENLKVKKMKERERLFAFMVSGAILTGLTIAFPEMWLIFGLIGGLIMSEYK